MSGAVKFEVEFEVKCVFYERHTLNTEDVKEWMKEQTIYPKSNDDIEIEYEDLTDDEVNHFIQFLNEEYPNQARNYWRDEDEPYYVDEPSGFENYDKEVEGLPLNVTRILDACWEEFLEKHEEPIVKRVMKEAEEKAAKELKEAEEKVEETFTIDITAGYKTLLKQKDEEIKSLYSLIEALEKKLATK